MSDRPPPGAAANAAVHRAEALTPESIERILADFRAWLEELARSGAAPPSQPVRDEELEPIDLFTLLGQMTALRHEVHLQTRAVRAQQEQNAQTLEQLGAALEALREAPSAAAEDGLDEDERLRPLLKTLVDLYDALFLAAREVQRVQEAVLSALEASSPSPPVDGLQSALDQVREWEAARERVRGPHGLSGGLLVRWLGAGRAERDALDAAGKAIAVLSEHLADRPAPAQPERDISGQACQMLESVVTGYTMSLQRVERALRQHELEPIPCVGQPFDPERMEVLEATANTGRPSGEVVDEIRRGYLWRGWVFRCAQVRVARS